MESYYELYLQYAYALEIEMNTVLSYPTQLTNLDTMLTILQDSGFSVSTSYMTVPSLQHLLWEMLVNSSEEKKLDNNFLVGDPYLHQQVILIKKPVQDLTHITDSIQCQQETKQKDFFMKTLRVFLNSLSK